MSWHLKALGYNVYKTITKESHPNDSKHIEANAIALKALRASLSKENLNMVSHCDSAFAVWNILTSPELQTQINKREKSSGEESEHHCFMVQENDSLEVHSDTQLHSASSSCDDYIDLNALNEELSIVCEKLLEKYNLLKKKSFELKDEIRICVQNLI